MAHKTLIGGTAYEIKGGRDLIGGTGYSKKNGKVPIGGTAYDIPFSKGIPLNTITPGAILMLNESGSPVQFYIAKHDYESGLNGAGRTLVVRRTNYNSQAFDTTRNNFITSSIFSWLNYQYWMKLDAAIRTAADSTLLYYTRTYPTPDQVLSTQAVVFLLSCTELGYTATAINVEGSALPIAATLRNLMAEGDYTDSWTRSPNINISSFVLTSTYDGKMNGRAFSDSRGVRPAFTLPGTLVVVPNADGTYSIAA